MSDDDAVDVEVESPTPPPDAAGRTAPRTRLPRKRAVTPAPTVRRWPPPSPSTTRPLLGRSRRWKPISPRRATTNCAARPEEVEELTSKARPREGGLQQLQAARQAEAGRDPRARRRALVERITPVRNDLLRALDQEEEGDLRPGVESTLEKFDEVLADEGVEAIDPEPGEEVDPARHQVMLRVESDQPSGTVHEVYEPGYEMGDRVVSEAKVTVSADEE